MPLVIGLLAILIICYIFEVIFELIGASWFWFDTTILPFTYSILGVVCFILAGLYLIYFKPHEAEAHLYKYKKGMLSCAEASNNIVRQMYDPVVHGAPSAFKSRIRKKRAERLKRILDAETELMESISKNIKYKELKDK